MNKIFIYVQVILLLLISLFIFNCTGVNGNPTELTGIWVCEYSSRSTSGNKTVYYIKLDIKDDGTTTMYKEQEEKWTGGDHSKETNKGNIYGDPSSTPKTFVFVVNDKTVSVNGTKSESDMSNVSYGGTYYIQYSTPNKLFFDLEILGTDYVYVKQ